MSIFPNRARALLLLGGLAPSPWSKPLLSSSFTVILLYLILSILKTPFLRIPSVFSPLFNRLERVTIESPSRRLREGCAQEEPGDVGRGRGDDGEAWLMWCSSAFHPWFQVLPLPPCEFQVLILAIQLSKRKIHKASKESFGVIDDQNCRESCFPI